MSESYFLGQTLDDVMRSAMEAIQDRGQHVVPTQGRNRELTGVVLEITDPRARLSRTETRGKPYSCFGELCWYLAGSNELEAITYYLPRYKDLAEDDLIFGGYGPRLFTGDGATQVSTIIELLRKKPSSRQAVIQLFDAEDITKKHEDVPCTCVLQFMIRANALIMMTYMRSNDVYLGLPHDVFCFTMLQEIVARSLSVDLGVYKHFVGSLHLYDRDQNATQLFLDEGWQSTRTIMLPMPIGEPWAAIKKVLEVEKSIRCGDPVDQNHINQLAPYWADLVRLLQVFRYSKDKNEEMIKEVKGNMSSNLYDLFIDSRLAMIV